MAATAILGMGIKTTGAFIIAPPAIQGITMATATTIAIIATIIGRTMTSRGLMGIGTSTEGDESSAAVPSAFPDSVQKCDDGHHCETRPMTPDEQRGFPPPQSDQAGHSLESYGETFESGS